LCVPLLYTYISFKRKNYSQSGSQSGSQVGSQGGSLTARSFDLARPGLALPLVKTLAFNRKTLHNLKTVKFTINGRRGKTFVVAGVFLAYAKLKST